MSQNAVYFISYKVKKATDKAQFVQATKTLRDGFVSKQAGYISWQQMHNDDEWVDIITFDTDANLQGFLEASKTPDQLAMDFYSHINLPSCKMRIYSTTPSLD